MVSVGIGVDTHFDIGFQLDSVATMGRKAVERQGDWVRSLEMLNIVPLALLNNTAHQRTIGGAAAGEEMGRVGLWEVYGSIMKTTMETNKGRVESQRVKKFSQVHTGDQSVLPTPRHSFVALSLSRSAQCPCFSGK